MLLRKLQQRGQEAHRFAFDSSGRLLQKKQVKVDSLPRTHKQGFDFRIDRQSKVEDTEISRYIKNRQLELMKKGLATPDSGPSNELSPQDDGLFSPQHSRESNLENGDINANFKKGVRPAAGVTFSDTQDTIHGGQYQPKGTKYRMTKKEYETKAGHRFNSRLAAFRD